jgi:hypothetical protein
MSPERSVTYVSGTDIRKMVYLFYAEASQSERLLPYAGNTELDHHVRP